MYFIEMFDATNPEKGYNHHKGGRYGLRKLRQINVGEKIVIDALEEKMYAILRSDGVHERHDEIMNILDDIIALQDS